MNKKVVIGLPCYRTFPPETEEDYMRLMYHLGRRAQHLNFFLAIKRKSEQFRARNAITEAALQVGADYLFMLDDDHVFDWRQGSAVTPAYDIPVKLIEHLESDPSMGICGALYYQRGSECKPVIMKEGRNGGYFWMRQDQITNGLQPVAVTGGGCMMIKTSIFDRIKAPWFEAELDMGTDIQICEKARKAGFGVYCDTSLQLGHVTSEPLIITPGNRTKISMENARKYAGGNLKQGMDTQWENHAALNLYRQDAEEFLGLKFEDFGKIATRYSMADFEKYQDNLQQYYITRGESQLARQVVFHHIPEMVEQYEFFLSMINFEAEGRALDYCCGSAPIGFEIAMRGHHVDFIDIDGSAAYEFTKWRAKKRGIEDRCGWTLGGQYDYVLFMDAIEHLRDWRGVLSDVIARLKTGGAIITNYFRNNDFANVEHISMNHAEVSRFLTQNGVFPLNELLWVKKDLDFMDKGEVAA
jgi:2-polyprenyl-3-methyl-5-hydroxy-6-metoxy-1,4-benzoquinol methylase